MADEPTPVSSNTEQLRIKYAFWLAIVGLAIAAFLVSFLVQKGWTVSSDIVAVIGLFTSVLGTLVGAFFGLQIGAAGRDKDQQDRRSAEQLAQKALSALDPASARNIIGGSN